jgi:hypothetical protein
MTSSMLSCTSGNKSSRQVPRKTPPAKQFNKLITREYLKKREKNVNVNINFFLEERKKYATLVSEQDLRHFGLYPLALMAVNMIIV